MTRSSPSRGDHRGAHRRRPPCAARRRRPAPARGSAGDRRGAIGAGCGAAATPTRRASATARGANANGLRDGCCGSGAAASRCLQPPRLRLHVGRERRRVGAATADARLTGAPRRPRPATSDAADENHAAEQRRRRRCRDVGSCGQRSFGMVARIRAPAFRRPDRASHLRACASTRVQSRAAVVRFAVPPVSSPGPARRFRFRPRRRHHPRPIPLDPLPGKALADIGGRPMIEHVYRRAAAAALDRRR